MLFFVHNSNRKPWVTVLVASCISLGLMLCSVIFFHVWPPDFIWVRERTIATARSPDGNQFSVTQIWNGFYFYTVHLAHALPDGSFRVYVVDGDAAKWWSAEIVVDEEQRLATLIGGRGSGGYGGQYFYAENRFIRNGIEIDPAPTTLFPAYPDPRSPLGRGAPS